jgi:hypothetical protein
MPVYIAEWVLPMTGEPMRRASISIENGRIAAIGEALRPKLQISVAWRSCLRSSTRTRIWSSRICADGFPHGKVLDWIRRS